VSITVNPEQESRPPLRGPLFRLVQVVWVVLAILTLGIFFASVLAYYAQIGRPVEPYAVYGIAIDTVQVLVYFLAAVAIFQRKSDDWMAILVSTALLTIGVASLPTLEALVSKRATWQWPVDLVQGLGVGLILFVFYLFPDGRFVPHWTRPVAFLWVGWLVAWAVFPAVSVDRGELPLVLRYLSFLVWPAIEALSTLRYYLRVSSLLVVMLSWFGSGVFAQIYRYTHVSSPVQRQQTKWVVFGLTAGVVGYFGFQIPLLLIPTLRQPGFPRTLFYLIGEPVSGLLLILAPLSISVSILRRRLWDIDPIIKSTLVYGILTGGVTIIYLGGVFVFQRLFRALTGQQSDVAIVIATLVSASLVRLLSRRLQSAIDRLFYRERVDFRRAITTFSREVRTIIDLPELLRVLVVRTTDLLHITHGAVYLLNPDGAFQQAKTHNLPPDSDKEIELSLGSSSLDSLLEGRTVSQPRDNTFSMLVPLIAPRTEGSDLVGVLALGPRLSGQTYSREDRALLMGLADQAGTAIRVAQLIQEKEGEARRREEVEHRLEAYRNSPLGRAETFAQELLFEPEAALIELHRLAQASGQDPNSASLIDNLPRVLDGMRVEPIARLAEGFNYLLTSRVEPEMLPVGLRTLTGQLEDYPVEGLQYVCQWDPEGRFKEDQRPQARGLRYAAEALAAYRLSQTALQANSVGRITQLLPSLEGGQREVAAEVGQTASTTMYEPFQTLTQALFRLRPVAEALYAFERMDTSQDKLSYLASAVERLRRVEHLARTELGSADRPVVQRIAESWLMVITGAISELQTRAEIVCCLLTRHTWQEDVVPLVLTLRNEGRGAALNVRVTLVPKPEYTMLVESAQIDQIAPGEEVRVELRVRPHLPDGVDRFRARFVIAYADPRGSDQVENFADVVRLLAGERESFSSFPTHTWSAHRWRLARLCSSVGRM